MLRSESNRYAARLAYRIFYALHPKTQNIIRASGMFSKYGNESCMKPADHNVFVRFDA